MRTPWKFLKHWLFEEPPGPDDERAATIDGLRSLLDLLERSPEAKLPAMYGLTVYDTVHHVDHDAAIEHLRGKAKRLGGKWEKFPEGDSFYLVRDFGGGIVYKLGAPREAVCEKRVIGHRRVERPRYIPMPTESVVEEIVEWDCPAVLA